jgi:D-arabinose 1-dehydrogenase-like Zn-dependent alcohol dehydrogenase
LRYVKAGSPGANVAFSKRKAGLEAGALVAVQGVGSLGHLGIQFARNMGFKTVAIGLGPETAALALDLGAQLYYGFDSLTHAKSILVSPAEVGIDHLLPPYTPAKVEALSQWMDY